MHSYARQAGAHRELAPSPFAIRCSGRRLCAAGNTIVAAARGSPFSSSSAGGAQAAPPSRRSCCRAAAGNRARHRPNPSAATGSPTCGSRSAATAAPPPLPRGLADARASIADSASASRASFGLGQEPLLFHALQKLHRLSPGSLGISLRPTANCSIAPRTASERAAVPRPPSTIARPRFFVLMSARLLPAATSA